MTDRLTKASSKVGYMWIKESNITDIEKLKDKINRQQAEIERLEKEKAEFIRDYEEEIREYKAEIERLNNDIVNANKIAKSDAIKEFAKRLEEKADMDDETNWWVSAISIDNLVKEMVGE